MVSVFASSVSRFSGEQSEPALPEALLDPDAPESAPCGAHAVRATPAAATTARDRGRRMSGLESESA
jgi:hypothetical protein